MPVDLPVTVWLCRSPPIGGLTSSLDISGKRLQLKHEPAAQAVPVLSGEGVCINSLLAVLVLTPIQSERVPQTHTHHCKAITVIHATSESQVMNVILEQG